MNAHSLIAAALPESARPRLPEEPVNGICAVTGEFGLCLPRHWVLKESNCDDYLFAAPTSDYVGVDVFTAWNFGTQKAGKKRKGNPQRQTCWWCDGKEFRVVGKKEIRAITFDGSPSKPWAMWVTTSYKKHGAPRTPINYSARGVIGFDELQVNCKNENEIKEIWGRLREAQKNKIPRTVIQTLEISAGYLANLNWQWWIGFEDWAKPRRQMPLYKLLTYLLPSQEEIKCGFAL